MSKPIFSLGAFARWDRIAEWYEARGFPHAAAAARAANSDLRYYGNVADIARALLAKGAA